MTEEESLSQSLSGKNTAGDKIQQQMQKTA